MCDLKPNSFEPTFTLNGIPIIATLMSGLILSEEDREKGCGYPPSFARSQNIRDGIPGKNEEPAAMLSMAAFFLKFAGLFPA